MNNCPCRCHKPGKENRYISEAFPCCPHMGMVFATVVLPESEPGVEESFVDDSICEACDGTGEVEGRVCKDCGGKVYR